MALKIMAVDDEPEILRLIKTMMEPLGIEVLTIADSREAARRLEREKFHGVLVDVKMPHLDGFELVKRIRASRSNGSVPIVMLTGHDDVATMRAAFKAGVTFFLGKPFSPEKLRPLCSALRGAMLKEKRRYARLPLRTVITCTSGQKSFKSGSLNISKGGMLVSPSGGLDAGQDVDLQFMLPLVSNSLKLRAKILRKETQDRIAVQFINLSPEIQEAIQSYIDGSVKE